MDGTLLGKILRIDLVSFAGLIGQDSTPAVEATWQDFSEKHGLDIHAVLASQ
jgi:hypothetical protein